MPFVTTSATATPSTASSAAAAWPPATSPTTSSDAVQVEFTTGSAEVVQFYPSADRADSLSYAGYVFRR
jgi:hypothetical protein